MSWLGYRSDFHSIADLHADDRDCLPTGHEHLDRIDKVTMEDDRVREEDEFIASWVEQLRSQHPNAVAILLKGSHARGDTGAFSDIDLDVLIDGAVAVLVSLVEHAGMED